MRVHVSFYLNACLYYIESVLSPMLAEINKEHIFMNRKDIKQIFMINENQYDTSADRNKSHTLVIDRRFEESLSFAN